MPRSSPTISPRPVHIHVHTIRFNFVQLYSTEKKNTETVVAHARPFSSQLLCRNLTLLKCFPAGKMSKKKKHYKTQIIACIRAAYRI